MCGGVLLFVMREQSERFRQNGSRIFVNILKMTQCYTNDFYDKFGWRNRRHRIIHVNYARIYICIHVKFHFVGTKSQNIYIYIYIYIIMYTHTQALLYAHEHIHTHTYIQTDLYACKYIYISIYTHTRKHSCMT